MEFINKFCEITISTCHNKWYLKLVIEICVYAYKSAIIKRAAALVNKYHIFKRLSAIWKSIRP